MKDAVLAEYVRDGFVESVHRGYLLALNADGSTAFELGDSSTLGARWIEVRTTVVGARLLKPFRI
jgi:L-asparaginase II